MDTDLREESDVMGSLQIVMMGLQLKEVRTFAFNGGLYLIKSQFHKKSA